MSGGIPVIIIGAGGHAKVLAALLDAVGAPVLGFTDNDPARLGGEVLGHPVLGDDAVIDDHAPSSVELAVGVGSTRACTVRREIHDAFAAKGYRFRTCVHPAAWVSPDARIGAGAQIMAGAIVQPGCTIGAGAIVNTRATVDHDCRIGAHAHVAPGAVLNGSVSVGADTHVGAASVVLQNLTLGKRVTVGAGAVVTKNIADGSSVAGVPARNTNDG